jgi:hypothetical protein
MFRLKLIKVTIRRITDPQRKIMMYYVHHIKTLIIITEI